MVELVTGEAVALELRPASLPSRLLAGLIDALLQLVLLGVTAYGLAQVATGSAAAAAAGGVALLVLVGVGYPVALETLTRGRTVGKLAMGLRVVRDDGGPIGFRQALVRGLAGAFLERPGVTLFLLSVGTVLVNRSGKRVGDLLAGTLVLQERVPGAPPPPPDMPPQLAAWAASLDLTGVDPGLAQAARTFAGRAGQLSAAAREDLGGSLVDRLLQAVRSSPPPGASGAAVLAAVLAERRRRDLVRQSGSDPKASSPEPTGRRPSAADPPDRDRRARDSRAGDSRGAGIPLGRAAVGPPPLAQDPAGLGAAPASTTGFAPPG